VKGGDQQCPRAPFKGEPIDPRRVALACAAVSDSGLVPEGQMCSSESSAAKFLTSRPASIVQRRISPTRWCMPDAYPDGWRSAAGVTPGCQVPECEMISTRERGGLLCLRARPAQCALLAHTAGRPGEPLRRLFRQSGRRSLTLPSASPSRWRATPCRKLVSALHGCQASHLRCRAGPRSVVTWAESVDPAGCCDPFLETKRWLFIYCRARATR